MTKKTMHRDEGEDDDDEEIGGEDNVEEKTTTATLILLDFSLKTEKDPFPLTREGFVPNLRREPSCRRS